MSVDKRKIKVALALSGGVDSATSLYLLKKEGYDVTAVFTDYFKCRTGEGPACCSADAVRKARQTAALLDAPFYLMDLKKEFEENVVSPFIDYYSRGLTPNPCIWCNSKIRFGIMAERLFSMGFSFIATGHYARTISGRLFRGRDPKKDQVYFLIGAPKNVLERTIFPLGEFYKKDVFKIATEAGLPPADSEESQDCCIPVEETLNSFLEDKIGAEKGRITDTAGNIIGEHAGIHNYTPGQRKGLGSFGSRKYVVRIVPSENRVIIGDEEDLYSDTVFIMPERELSGKVFQKEELSVKLRSTHIPALCRVEKSGKGLIKILFDKPQRAPAPGQAAVLYCEDEVIGGGEIVCS